MGHSTRERGQVSPLIAVVVVVTAAAALLVGEVGTAVMDRAQARTAAVLRLRIHRAQVLARYYNAQAARLNPAGR